MAELKTKLNKASVTKFLNGIKDETKRKDAFTISKIMQKVTKEKPKMWGSSIVGFGSYHYKGASGREGVAQRTRRSGEGLRCGGEGRRVFHRRQRNRHRRPIVRVVSEDETTGGRGRGRQAAHQNTSTYGAAGAAADRCATTAAPTA